MYIYKQKFTVDLGLESRVFTSTANMERKMITLMKMENYVKQSLEFMEERSNRSAFTIKYYFVPLLPYYINNNTKRETPHSTICIVSTLTQPLNSTAYGWHAPRYMQLISNHLPEKGGLMATKEHVVVWLLIHMVEDAGWVCLEETKPISCTKPSQNCQP